MKSIFTVTEREVREKIKEYNKEQIAELAGYLTGQEMKLKTLLEEVILRKVDAGDLAEKYDLYLIDEKEEVSTLLRDFPCITIPKVIEAVESDLCALADVTIRLMKNNNECWFINGTELNF